MLQDFMTNNHYKSTGGSDTPNITGFIYVDNDTAVDELTIKNNFVTKYPQLTFFFKTVNKCYSAKFVLPNDDGSFSYVSFIDENIVEPTIQKIGADDWFENPYNLYVATKDNYDFHGWSTTKDDSGLIASADWDSAKASIFNASQWDYTFYAVFTIHKFQMTYYDGDGSVLEVVPVPAGASVVANGPKSLPYKEMEDTLENFYQVYKFIGWSTRENDTTPLEWSDATIERSNRDRRFYPVFRSDSVYNNVLSEDFLVGNDVYVNGVNGVNIGLKPGYSVKGKITLPKEFNEKPVLGIKEYGFAVGFDSNSATTYTGADKITMVFWEEGAAPVSIKAYAFATFSSNSSLKYFEFLPSLDTIEAYSFYRINYSYNSVPSTAGLINRDLAAAMPRLRIISGNAFNRAFAIVDNQTTLTIPGSVTSIGQNALRYNGDEGYGIATIELGSDGVVSRLDTIGNSALLSGGSNPYALIIHTDNQEAAIWQEVIGNANAVSISWSN
jgi:hypothetical protein